MKEVVAVGTVAVILAVAGLVWAAVASKRARDDRDRLKAAMQRLAEELKAADLAQVQGLFTERGLGVKAAAPSTPEDIVARVVELAKTPARKGAVNIGAGRRTASKPGPEDHNQQGPPAPASH